MTARNAHRRRALAVPAIFLLAALFAACQNPWIRVQNIGSTDADVSITFYDDNGQAIANDTQPLPPGNAANFAEGSNLPKGYRGSAVIESDQPALALRRIDMAGNSGEMIDGDILSAITTGGSLYLPLIMSHAGPYQTWSSRVSLQNLGDAAACVTLTYISATGGGEVLSDPRAASPRTATETGCPNGGHALASRATLYRDADSFGVASGFSGALRIDTAANAQGISRTAQIISASVDNSNLAFNLLTSYRALTASDLGTTVLLPLIEREVGSDGAYSSRFQIVARDASQPTQVRLHLEGVDGGGNPVSKDNTIAIKGAGQCELVADDAANCLAAGDTLPTGFSGSARLVASTPIGVVVQRGSYFADFGNYRGIPDSQAATRVALPAVNGHSWIRIRVADGGGATVRIRYFGGQLDGGEQSSTVGVNGTITVFQTDDPAVPGNFDGAAIIESDRPIAVVAWYSVGGGDHAFLYPGAAIP